MKTLRQFLIDCEVTKVYRHIHKKDSKNAAKCDRPSLAQVKNNYGKVVAELICKPPTKPDKMPLVVKKSFDPFDKEPFFEVLFLNPNYTEPPKDAKPWFGKKNKMPKKGYYNSDSDKYNQYFAIGFISWSKLIDTPVHNLTNLSDEEMLGEVLWELTFWGWTEEKVKDHVKDLEGKIDQAIKEVKEGKCVTLSAKKKGGFKVVIPDCVTKQFIDIVNKEKKPIKKCGANPNSKS